MPYHSQSTAVLTAQQLSSNWENSALKLTPQLWGKAHKSNHNTDLHLTPAAPSAFSESTILLPALDWWCVASLKGWAAGRRGFALLRPALLSPLSPCTGTHRDPATPLTEAAARPVPKAKLLGHPRGSAGNAAERWDTTHSCTLQTLHLCCRKCTATRLLSRTTPCQPSCFPGTAQNRARRQTFIYKCTYTAASFVSVLLKGTNYIHGSKVVIKCIRRDSTPLTDSSETRLGDKRAGGRATARQEIPFPFLRGEQSSAVLFEVAHSTTAGQTAVRQRSWQVTAQGRHFHTLSFPTLKPGQNEYSGAHLLTWNFRKHVLAARMH